MSWRENRGDAISDGLPVTVDQRYIDGKIDTGARHHLSLERVAVQIDYPGSNQQATGIEPNDMTPWSEPTALIFSAGDLHEVSRMVLSRRARPPSINIVRYCTSSSGG